MHSLFVALFFMDMVMCLKQQGGLRLHAMESFPKDTDCRAQNRMSREIVASLLLEVFLRTCNTGLS